MTSGDLDSVLQTAAARLLDSHPGEVNQRFIDLVEEPLFRAALSRTKGNQLRAAELLGINRTRSRNAWIP